MMSPRPSHHLQARLVLWGEADRNKKICQPKCNMKTGHNVRVETPVQIRMSSNVQQKNH